MMKFARPLRTRPLLAAAAAACLTLSHAPAGAQPQPKVVRIVTEGGFVPWNYTNPDGSLGGFEIDLAQDLCARMGVKCSISAQAFESMIPALNAGKYDAIMDDLAATPKREQVIAFSVPYAVICYTFATLKNNPVAKRLPQDKRVISLNDEAGASQALAQVKSALGDKVLGTMAAGTSVEFAKSYLKDVSMRQYKTPQARDLDLLAGRVDAILGSRDSLVAAAAKPGNEGMVLAGACFEGGVIGKGAAVGLRKGDIELKAMFDKAIREALADGTIQKLSQKFFNMDVTPGN